jgi:hypothetical protein
MDTCFKNDLTGYFKALNAIYNGKLKPVKVTKKRKISPRYSGLKSKKWQVDQLKKH